ncbi:MAG: HAD hydrolase family protein [Candidatus Omnitrophica bacterium]|nr:HAD hydrolase family protein [Candidatus Omnitrophota bacterium]
MDKRIRALAKKIKLLVLDVDGVLTDGFLYYGNDGDEVKAFDVRDGFGVYLLKRSGVSVAILTAKGAPLVQKRADEIRVDKVYKDFHYKIEALGLLKRDFKVRENEICFIGDELLDLPILKRVGLAVAVPNAVSDVKKLVPYVTRAWGGRGAVREVCEIIMKAQGTWEKVTEPYRR